MKSRKTSEISVLIHHTVKFSNVGFYKHQNYKMLKIRNFSAEDCNFNFPWATLVEEDAEER